MLRRANQEEQKLASIVSPARRKSRLFPYGAILGLALTGALALALVFPRESLLRVVAEQDDPLTVAYRHLLLELPTTGEELKLRLAQRYFRTGNAEQALALLKGLANLQADALRLSFFKTRYFDALALGKPQEAQQARAEIEAILQRVAPQSFAEWKALLELVQGLDASEGLYRFAAQGRRFLPLPLPLALQVGQLLVGAQAHELAAEVLFASANDKLTKAELLALVKEGVRALLAANRSGEAYQRAVEALAHGEVSAEEAWFLAELALGANQPTEAARWLRRAVDLTQPAAELGKALTPAQRELAWQILVGVGDLEGALRIAEAAITALGGKLPQAKPCALSCPDHDTGVLLEPSLKRWLQGLAEFSFVAEARAEEAASSLEPNDRDELQRWEERRAQILEWQGKPEEALQQWRALLQRKFSPHALEQVHRLNLALGKGGELEYWSQLAARRELSAEEWKRYAIALESAGDWEEALRVLRQGAEKHPELFAFLAWQLNQHGKIDESLKVYAEALARGRLDLTARIDYAVLLLQNYKFERALEVLKTTQSSAPSPPALRAVHLGMLGDIAWELNASQLALAAYAKLWHSEALRLHASPHHFLRYLRLVRKLQGEAPALALAKEMWRSVPSEALALVWLEALSHKPSLEGLEEWQQEVLSSPVGEELRKRPAMYIARAQAWQALGRSEEAFSDLRAALALPNSPPEVAIALLWLEIDSERQDELRRDFAHYVRELQSRPSGLEVLAAAARTLGDAQLAVRYAQKLYPRKKNDALWLIYYGDLLAQAGEGLQARAAYDQAWRLLSAPHRQTKKARSLDELLAGLRLGPERLDAASQQALIDALRVRLLEGEVKGEELLKVNAVIADWLLRLETAEPTRWWLTRHVLTLEARRSLEIQLALRDKDRQAVDRMLEEGVAHHLLPQDLPETKRAAGRPLEALSTAEEILDRTAARGQLNPALRPLEIQTAQQQLALSSQAAIGVESSLIDKVQRLGPSLQLAWQFDEQLGLRGRFTALQLESADTSALTGVPAEGHEGQLGMRWQGEKAWLNASLLYSSGLGSSLGARLTGEADLPSGVRWMLEAEYHAPAIESGPLYLAGTRDRVRLGLTRQFGRAWASLNTALVVFRTRSSDKVGSGKNLRLELGYWLRRSEPDLSFRIWGHADQFAASDKLLPRYAVLVPQHTAPTGEFFMPVSDVLFGLSLGFNTAHSETYSRRWWPFAELDLMYSWRFGPTVGVMVGLRGPVFSHDQLYLGGWHFGLQPPQSARGQSNQWVLRYQRWFGR